MLYWYVLVRCPPRRQYLTTENVDLLCSFELSFKSSQINMKQCVFSNTLCVWPEFHGASFFWHFPIDLERQLCLIIGVRAENCVLLKNRLPAWTSISSIVWHKSISWIKGLKWSILLGSNTIVAWILRNWSLRKIPCRECKGSEPQGELWVWKDRSSHPEQHGATQHVRTNAAPAPSHRLGWFWTAHPWRHPQRESEPLKECNAIFPEGQPLGSAFLHCQFWHVQHVFDELPLLLKGGCNTLVNSCVLRCRHWQKAALSTAFLVPPNHKNMEVALSSAVCHISPAGNYWPFCLLWIGSSGLKLFSTKY